jgi:hypothetical protein
MGKEPDQRQAHSPASGAQRSTTALAITKRFRQRYGGAPRIFQAPGRINIIGEHTDYCGGLVMPAAIEQRCFVAVAANGTRRLRVTAAAFSDEASGNLDALRPVGGWFDYVAGVAHSLMAAGIAVLGADLWIESLVPIGSGFCRWPAKVRTACRSPSGRKRLRTALSVCRVGSWISMPPPTVSQGRR